jgi:hypothetical protein
VVELESKSWSSANRTYRGAVARQRYNLRGAGVSLTRRTASRRAGGGSSPLHELLVHATPPTNSSGQTPLGDRMSTANKKTGRRQLGNLPQPFSHLALIETMPGMIVLERRAEL